MAAKPLSGEVEVRLQGNLYVLRPSFAALYAIEQQAACSLFLLARALEQMPPEVLRVIACEGLAAAGNPVPENQLTDDALKAALPSLRAFFLPWQAPCDWADLYQTVTGLMERSSREFWQMTLPEYALTFKGFCLRNGIDPLAFAPPATPQELERMMERFPDGESYSERMEHDGRSL